MRPRASPRAPVPAEGLLHPIALAALLLLALNDHWGKGAWPGMVTGKVSDFAGLTFFPLVLQAAWELGCTAARVPWRPSRRVLLAATLLTGVVFAATKVWAPASECYRVAFGLARWPIDAVAAALRSGPVPSLTRVLLARDPTDLVALPALLLALWCDRSRRGGGRRRKPAVATRPGVPTPRPQLTGEADSPAPT